MSTDTHTDAAAEREWRTESVLVATPHRPDVQAAYLHSLLRAFAYDATSTGLMVRGGGPVLFQASPMNLHAVRNTLAKGMLDETTADWLCFIDADAGFDQDAVERLVEAADPVERPIVGALAFMVDKGKVDGQGGFYWNPAPTLYRYGKDKHGKDGFIVLWDYPPDTLVEVAATGCHMLLIHRCVLEKIRQSDGDHWFTRGVMFAEQGLLGEDFSFCVRAKQHGFPIYVHTGVRTSHQQTVWLHESDYLAAVLVKQHGDQVAAQATQLPDGVLTPADLSTVGRGPTDA